MGMAQRAWNRLFTSVSDDEKFMVVVLVVYNVKEISVKSKKFDSKLNTTFWVVRAEKYREQRNI